MAILVPLAIASTTWAAVSFNTPIREATHSWFPDGYNVAVAPGKSKAPEEQVLTTEDESDPSAGSQNDDTQTGDARNRVPVTASPSPSADDESDSSSSSDSSDSSSDSGEQDAPEPKQPEPTRTKDVPVPPTTAPTPPPTSEPEPTPSAPPTTDPTDDPGDEGEEEEDGGIIDIDIELPLPLPLLAPGPEAPVSGTDGLVDNRGPSAVPGTGIQQPSSLSLNVADLLTWTYVVWQSIG